ncbi:DUF418 domain-containing protein [Bacillus sp. NPDC077027]|uniref:DUF418 domain-containing protein n=1 Tax=Bacillus sp. NPDC077027 TaxID=3390548 RepID=UPI003D01AF2B
MKGSRVELIDSLRGFSLLGILIANMLSFQYNADIEELLSLNQWGNEFGYYFTAIFVQGSFYPIFSFLFGYSLIKLVELTKAKELNTNAILVRRGFGLVFLGLLHYVFVWDGDILMFYGACTIFLMIFLGCKEKIDLIWAGILGALSLVVIPYLMIVLYGDTDLFTDVFAEGMYADVVKHRLGMTDDMLVVSILIAVFMIVLVLILSSVMGPIMVAPFALLGMAIAKRGHLTEEDQGKAYCKGWLWFILIGWALKCATFSDHPLSEVVVTVGAYVLAIGYIKGFIVFYYSSVATGVKRLFAGLGRLSLTNYLAQSLICTTIFYQYGLGLFGQMGMLFGFVLALCLYTVQLLLSHWYLKKWKKGPVEWLMGKWVYLK